MTSWAAITATRMPFAPPELLRSQQTLWNTLKALRGAPESPGCQLPSATAWLPWQHQWP